MSKRKLKPRPTYRQHSEAVVHADIKRAAAQGTAFFDWLTEIRLEPVGGVDLFNIGRAEGVRELAAQIQDIALAENRLEE